MIPNAIIQCADTGPLESLVDMFSAIGIKSYIPNDALKRLLRSAGCDNVLDISSLVRGWGYEQPFPIPEAGIDQFNDRDFIYVDVKAHRNGPKLWREHDSLRSRTLWYRINGGRPEHVIRGSEDCGNEINPPCPVLTPNLWYREEGPWMTKSYATWPPFYRFEEYSEERPTCNFHNPLCLIHNLTGWGYAALVEGVRKLGVRCHGAGSPDGLIKHGEVRVQLTKTIAMVHLKSSDAPGYALYEALAAGCPLIVSRRLIWRNRMQELFVPGETCLAFDRETHDPLSPSDVENCLAEIKEALSRLRDPGYNRKIGLAGKDRLKGLMWNKTRKSDIDSLTAFMGRHFRCQGTRT